MENTYYVDTCKKISKKLLDDAYKGNLYIGPHLDHTVSHVYYLKSYITIPISTNVLTKVITKR